MRRQSLLSQTPSTGPLGVKATSDNHGNRTWVHEEPPLPGAQKSRQLSWFGHLMGTSPKDPPPTYSANLGTFNWTETFRERPRASPQAILVPSAPGRPYQLFSSRSWKASPVTRIVESSLFSLLPSQQAAEDRPTEREGGNNVTEGE